MARAAKKSRLSCRKTFRAAVTVALDMEIVCPCLEDLASLTYWRIDVKASLYESVMTMGLQPQRFPTKRQVKVKKKFLLDMGQCPAVYLILSTTWVNHKHYLNDTVTQKGDAPVRSL